MSSSYLHTGFSRGRSGGLVFPSLGEFSTVCCDPNSQRLWHSQLGRSRCFSGTLAFSMVLWMLASWSLVPSPHVQLPPRVAGPSFDSSFLFFFLLSTLLWGNFSCPFRCLKSSVNVQQFFSENCSICRRILDVLRRREKFFILHFHYLDSPPPSPRQGLLSFIELGSQKTKFLEFF